jgi:hypothetical protein
MTTGVISLSVQRYATSMMDCRKALGTLGPAGMPRQPPTPARKPASGSCC